MRFFIVTVSRGGDGDLLKSRVETSSQVLEENQLGSVPNILMHVLSLELQQMRQELSAVKAILSRILTAVTRKPEPENDEEET